MERLFWSLSKLVFGAYYTKACCPFCSWKRRHYVLFRLPQGSGEVRSPLTSPLILFSSLIALNFILFRGEFLQEFIYIPPNMVRQGFIDEALSLALLLLHIPLFLFMSFLFLHAFFFTLKFMIVEIYVQQNLKHLLSVWFENEISQLRQQNE